METDIDSYSSTLMLDSNHKTHDIRRAQFTCSVAVGPRE